MGKLVIKNGFNSNGDSQITGSLTISGSFITSRNSDLSNTVIGSASAAAMNSGATGNVIIGNEAANSLTSGDDNVIIGENAAKTVTSGYDNVYIGHSSGLQAHTTNAIGNVVIGVDAGLGSGGALSSRNVFVGQAAGYNVDGQNNVYVGREAGRGEAGADGTSNSGFGAFALTDNRDGNYNIGIGYYAGGAIKDGSNNIFIGSGSLGELNTEAQLRIGHADLITISASLATGDIIFPSTASATYLTGNGSELTNLQRPITSSSTNLSASMDNAGYYFRVGGNVTCSIGTNAVVPIKTGTEFEFFQTSSAGNFYITGSGITINSKGGDIQLAGQFSAATLKKVGTDEWDLIGDLG